jgi:hypothetical protein
LAEHAASLHSLDQKPIVADTHGTCKENREERKRTAREKRTGEGGTEQAGMAQAGMAEQAGMADR